ncbi:MAG: cysteine desulfurase / selenocysteine lyase [Pseudomonadota bacterium]|nr:cysteine desulfurase / selenocysteine lyase [Pseudomonadota bacterium]
MLNVEQIRKDFPILHQTVNGYPLVYFDNAATTQKPKQVIDSITNYYETINANVHRGVHDLSARATMAYETAREKIAHFIGAKSSHECIFVRGTTEAINLVANSYFLPLLQEGDEIVLTHMEHHANIVPWQMICEKTGAILKIAPIALNGELMLERFAELLGPKTKAVACCYASNALGSINPVEEMIKMAHAVGAKVVIDGAQSTPHLPIDVQALDADFYALSGHKMYGPTGIGVLWGRAELLDAMPPYQGGGEMITHVSFDLTEYAPVPYKFEAGTPNIEGAIGLAAAVDYLQSLDLRQVLAYEAALLEYATERLKALKGFNILGTSSDKVPVLSFVHGKIHAHDIGTILDTQGIAIRSGHHCAMPLMDFLDVAATARISLSFYNTREEIDRCMQSLEKVKEVFG